MALADGDVVARKRDVECVVRQPAAELGSLELGLPSLERRFDTLADSVQLHARLTVTHVAERDLQLALPAEPGGVGLGQLPGRGRFRETLESLVRVPVPVHRPNLAFEQLR